MSVYTCILQDNNYYVNVTENIINVHFHSPEKDYPPVARAGNDVVIVLPVDHVTLYGNGSTDDKVQHLSKLVI